MHRAVVRVLFEIAHLQLASEVYESFKGDVELVEKVLLHEELKGQELE